MHHTFVTHVGRHREENQDSFATCPDAGVFVVADGMGGHRGGSEASRMAVAVVERVVRWCAQAGALEQTIDPMDWAGVAEHPASALPKRCLTEAHEAIVTANRTARRMSEAMDFERATGMQFDMGTTLLLVHLSGADGRRRHYTAGWCGDSRLYQWVAARQALVQISDDHSAAREHHRVGASESTTPAKNILINAVGIDGFLRADLAVGVLEPGDALLLCTDGLTNEVDDAAIAQTFQSALSDPRSDRAGAVQRLAEDLLEQALAHGGRDNITLGVLGPSGP